MKPSLNLMAFILFGGNQEPFGQLMWLQYPGDVRPEGRRLGAVKDSRLMSILFFYVNVFTPSFCLLDETCGHVTIQCKSATLE